MRNYYLFQYSDYHGTEYHRGEKKQSKKGLQGAAFTVGKSYLETNFLLRLQRAIMDVLLFLARHRASKYPCSDLEWVISFGNPIWLLLIGT